MASKSLQAPWRYRAWRTLLATVVVCILLYVVPTPFVLRAPGRAADAESMVTIRGTRTYPSQGNILLTTVIYDRATALYCVYAALDPYAELVPLEDAHDLRGLLLDSGPQDPQMSRSQYLAKCAALRQMGYSLAPKARGARVLGILASSPARGILRPGDLIVTAGDREIHSSGDLTGFMREWAAGEALRLQVVRADHNTEVELTPIPADQGALIGIQIRTELEAASLPLDIQIESGNVSGASGGLAFALAIINQLTEEDITNGYRVAATGTIEPNGTVGPISGAGLKSVAADRAGADVFLCPLQNVNEARSTSPNLPIIGVSDLRQALDRLDRLPDKSNPPDPNQ